MRLDETLVRVHKITARVQGEIALALASRRGVTPDVVREWVVTLRESAQILDDFLGEKSGE